MKTKKMLVALMVGALFVSPATLGQQQQQGVDQKVQQMGIAFAAVEAFLNKENLQITQSPEQAFTNGYILVMGEGLPSPNAKSPGQERLTAERAATVMAYRALAEMLDGVAVVGDTVVKDMELQYDVVRAAVAGFVKGAQVVYKHYDPQEKVATVLVKVGMHGPQGFASLMYDKFLKDPNIKSSVIKEPPQMTAKPVPVEQNFDGLIIDASGLNFRPALLNRIFNTKGEAVYDPSKISMQILNDFGCGEYTNDIEKAKQVLEKRGVKNPMIVKATGTMTISDLVVSDEDAVRIYSANQKSGFLNSAKVAFVLR